MSLRRCTASTLLGLLTLSSAAFGQTASLTTSGYSENFDSMGTTGTTPPSGWRHFSANFGTNGTWFSSIPASGANSIASTPVATATTTLTATTTPAGNNNNAFNAAASAAQTADRVLATAPTGIAGTIIQLQIANQTGADLVGGSTLTVAFDTIRYTVATNQLPGHWVFISLDGTTWTNITPNPTSATVPSSAGVTSTSLNFVLSNAWLAGTTAYLRFVDDNAQETSPDQIIGLNNVVINSSAGNPNGRCCFPDGSCTSVTTGVCTGGTFTSGGVCSPNTCAQPPQGSCCATDGSCTITTQFTCATGSTWTNAGVCLPNTCYTPIASIGTAGYAQNFDTLAPTGTALPAGYSFWSVVGDRPTFEEIANGGTGVIDLPAIPTATIVSPPGILAVYNQSATATPGTRNAGYNFGFSADLANRLLGVSPTGNGASFIQLRLRNDSGAPVSAVTISYTFRVMSPWTANELAGYRFFYSLTGPTGTYFAVPALDGIATSGLLTGAAIAESASITLPSALAPGAEMILRWGDDNGNASPDQAYAIDNVAVSLEDPALLGACCSGGNCTLTGDDNCSGEQFLGVGTTCNPNNCPQPPSGSCCASNGSCSVTTQSNCATLWTLAGTCTPNICPGPLSACCAADGTCTIVTAAAQCSGAGSFLIVDGACNAIALCKQPGSTRFVAFGDYGVVNANQLAVANRMKTFNPDFMVTTGDNTYNTSTAISNYDNTQAQYYGEFIKVANPASAYFAQYGNNVNRFFPCMGNHDFDIGGGAAGAIPYWNAYWELPGNERYYTFSRGPIDFFVLSSDGREPDSDLFGGTQYNWFVNAYNASTAKFKIVTFHHPPYTNPSTHGPDAQMLGWNFPNFPGITAVMNGHNHNMQRLEVPRGGAGVGTGASPTVPFMVTGAGGNSLYAISGAAQFNAFFNATDFGFLLIDATSGSITFRFISAAGTILDTRVITLPGACCTPAGACSLTADAAGCTGTFQGAGTVCAPSPCAPLTGACCAAASCSITTATACAGLFQGVATVCGPANNPTTCCPANFNGVNGVTVQDIFDFLSAWFSGIASANFNGVNGVTVQDIFDFLAAWFSGCS